MLLEYVSGGTLTNYLHSTEPPTKVGDIFDIWGSLLELIKPLIRMHNMSVTSPMQQSFQWYVSKIVACLIIVLTHISIHQDIKPDNILVSPGKSTYRPLFKLVDMGLTTLEEKRKNAKDAISRDAQGTQMYSKL